MPLETPPAGWKLLREGETIRDSAEARRAPRSLQRITPENLKLMVADYETGMPAYEMAEKNGHHRATVIKHLAQAGVRSRVAAPTDEEISRWRELRARVFSFKTIATQVERNHK